MALFEANIFWIQGPAAQTRLRVNDYIHELDGKKVHAMSVQDVVEQILVGAAAIKNRICAACSCVESGAQELIPPWHISPKQGKHGSVLNLTVSDSADAHKAPQQQQQAQPSHPQNDIMGRRPQVMSPDSGNRGTAGTARVEPSRRRNSYSQAREAAAGTNGVATPRGAATLPHQEVAATRAAISRAPSGADSVRKIVDDTSGAGSVFDDDGCVQASTIFDGHAVPQSIPFSMNMQRSYAREKNGAYLESKESSVSGAGGSIRAGASALVHKNQIVVKEPGAALWSDAPSAVRDSNADTTSVVTYSLLQGSPGNVSGTPRRTESGYASEPRNGPAQGQGELLSPTSQRINAIKDSAERIRTTLQKHSKDHEEARRILSRPSAAASGMLSRSCIRCCFCATDLFLLPRNLPPVTTTPKRSAPPPASSLSTGRKPAVGNQDFAGYEVVLQDAVASGKLGYRYGLTENSSGTVAGPIRAQPASGRTPHSSSSVAATRAAAGSSSGAASGMNAVMCLSLRSRFPDFMHAYT